LFVVHSGVRADARRDVRSFLWEWFIRKFHYRDLEDLAPTNSGLYEGTPVSFSIHSRLNILIIYSQIVNSAFLNHIREKRVDYVRGDTERLTASGVLVKRRPPGTKSGEKPSTQVELKGDVVVLATGFKRPSLDFLPQDLFPEEFQRPNLYLQNFAVKDWTVLCTNSSYMSGIGTVGHLCVLSAPFVKTPNKRLTMFDDVQPHRHLHAHLAVVPPRAERAARAARHGALG
jgi:hypothetical protein